MNDYLSKILKEYNSKVIKKNYVIIVLYCREAEHAALSLTKVLKLALIRALMNNRNLIPSFLSSKIDCIGFHSLHSEFLDLLFNRVQHYFLKEF